MSVELLQKAVELRKRREPIVEGIKDLRLEAVELLRERGRIVESRQWQTPSRVKYCCDVQVEGDMPVRIEISSWDVRKDGTLTDEPYSATIEVGELPPTILSKARDSMIGGKRFGEITQLELDQCRELIQAVKDIGR